MYFISRQDAAFKLLKKMEKIRFIEPVVVVGLARGGVEVAYYIAKGLGRPLDCICPKKISHPMNPEYALGAITEYKDIALNEKGAELIGIDHHYLMELKEEAYFKAKNKSEIVRKGRKEIQVEEATVLLVDDGLATGLTMLASIRSMKNKKAKKIIAVAPVASSLALKLIEGECDEIIVGLEDPFLSAVGEYFEDFSEVKDEVVINYLKT